MMFFELLTISSYITISKYYGHKPENVLLSEDKRFFYIPKIPTKYHYI